MKNKNNDEYKNDDMDESNSFQTPEEVQFKIRYIYTI